MKRISLTKEYLRSITETARQGRDPNSLWDVYEASKTERATEEYLAAAEGFRDYSRHHQEGLNYAKGCLTNALDALRRESKEKIKSPETILQNCKAIKRLAQNLGHIFRQVDVRDPARREEHPITRRDKRPKTNPKTSYQRTLAQKGRKDEYRKFLKGSPGLLGMQGILKIADKIEKDLK